MLVLYLTLVGVAAGGPPANDYCENAIGPLDIPSETSGTTIGAETDYAQAPPPCPGVGSVFTVDPGVWYSVVGTGGTLDVTVVGTMFTRVSVYCAPCVVPGSSCCTPLSEPGCDNRECERIVCGVDPFCCEVTWDNLCMAAAQEACRVCANLPVCVAAAFGTADVPVSAAWCSGVGQEYVILVQQGDAGGGFVMSVTDEGKACGEATSCIQCHSDIDGDGVVSVSDLVAIIENWGCAGSFCPGNVNFDTVVDVQDLLQVILDWGPCP